MGESRANKAVTGPERRNIALAGLLRDGIHFVKPALGASCNLVSPTHLWYP